MKIPWQMVHISLTGGAKVPWQRGCSPVCLPSGATPAHSSAGRGSGASIVPILTWFTRWSTRLRASLGTLSRSCRWEHHRKWLHCWWWLLTTTLLAWWCTTGWTGWGACLWSGWGYRWGHRWENRWRYRSRGLTTALLARRSACGRTRGRTWRRWRRWKRFLVVH